MYRSMNIKSLSVTVSALVLSTSVNAALIENNDLISNTYYDTEADLVWLDNRTTGWSSYSGGSYGSYSNGISFTVEQSLERNSDFRVATELEVRSLLDSAFSEITFDTDGNYQYNDSWSRSVGGASSVADPLFSTDYNDFLSVAGGTTYSSSRSYSDGDRSGDSRISGLYLKDDGTYGSVRIGSSYDSNYGRSCSWGRCYSVLASTRDSSSITHQLVGEVDLSVYRSSLWMVYDPTPTSVVPIPAAVWLFGSGLLGLVGVARRKKV